MEGSPINPGMGDDINAVLQRVAALEMELSRYQLMRVEVPVVGEGNQQLLVMAMREGAGPSSERPFMPILSIADGAGSVRVTRGHVWERAVDRNADSVIPHLPKNLYKEGTTELRSFAIGAGQAIYVKIRSLISGAIGVKDDPKANAVELVVAAADQKSEHYHPKFGKDSTGEPGTHYIRLGIFDGSRMIYDGCVPGQDIDYYPVLPTFETVGGDEITKKLRDDGVFEVKGFVAAGELTLTPNENDLTYQGNKKVLKVRFRESDASEPEENEDINFRDGLSTDGTVDAEEPPNRDVILPVVKGVSPILVERSGEANRTYTISYDGDEFPGGGNLQVSKTTVVYDSVNDAFFPSGSPEYFYWKNGLYIGTVSPFAPGDPFDTLDIASPEVS